MKPVCPFCKKDLSNAAKVLGCYETDLMVFHLKIHYNESVRQLKLLVRANATHTDLQAMVDTIEEIEKTMCEWNE